MSWACGPTGAPSWAPVSTGPGGAGAIGECLLGSSDGRERLSALHPRLSWWFFGKLAGCAHHLGAMVGVGGW